MISSESKYRLALDIALTSLCPLQCRFCSVEKGEGEELTAAQWRSVVASFARLRPVDLVSLEGGEPLVRPDLPAILGFCLEHSEWVKVVTGGTEPFSSLPQIILGHPRLIWELSLDGPREIHNYLRDGSWEQAWSFLQSGLEKGAHIRIRSVISRCNISVFQRWLTELDGALRPYGRKVEFSFDTLIDPASLLLQGGEFPRAAMRNYPSRGLLPSAAEAGRLFRNIKSTSYESLVFFQEEPLRGCQAAGGGFISFDPAGICSFCCEAPRGLGSIFHVPAEECLRLQEAQRRGLPCNDCPHRISGTCSGCWTGQKCGMVGYWGEQSCRALLDRAETDVGISELDEL